MQLDISEKHIEEYEKQINDSGNKFINYNTVTKIIFYVFSKFKQYLETNDLNNIDIISFTGSGYIIKKNNNKANYYIKYPESSSIKVSIADTFSEKELMNMGEY